MRTTLTKGEAIGLNILKARKARGLSQKALGKEIGKSREVVGHMETGYRPAEKSELMAISMALDWPLDKLEEPDVAPSIELGPSADCDTLPAHNELAALRESKGYGTVARRTIGTGFDGGPDGGTPMQLPLPRAA